MIARISAADSMPTPSGGPVKRGMLRIHSGVRDLELPHERAPARRCPTGRRRSTGSPPAARSGTPAAAQPGRRQLGDEDGDAERDRRRDDQRQNRRIERAPDERPRAELAGDRVPDDRSARTASRTARSTAATAGTARRRWPRRARSAAARTAPVPARKSDLVGTGAEAVGTAMYCSLICSSAFSSMLDDVLAAAARSRAPWRTSARRSAPTCMKSTIDLRLRLVLRILVEQQPRERRDRVGVLARAGW